MNRTPQDPEALLDLAIAGVRDDVPADGAVEDARRRAWARIAAHIDERVPEAAPAAQHDHLRSCEDFRALFPDFRAGTLAPARRALVQDHIRECVACRKALHPVTARLSPAAVVEMPRRGLRPMRWAAAAAAVLVVSGATWYGFDKFGPAPAGSRITVLAADGPVYKLANNRLERVAVGATFSDEERLRTPGGSHAIVRLYDGSTVEVAERAEFAVKATRRDTVVHLDRGQIIVQAAKRDRGHLYVASTDSRVAVTGTVFSVNRGLKGSRVSVIEGSVEVQYRGNERLLKAGDQAITDNSMSRVPIADEIAWSRNFEQHAALLRQVVDLSQKLQQVRLSTLRYNGRLLDSVPQGTTVFVSVPNLGRAMADVERIVKEQAAQSPELRVFLEREFPQFERIAKEMSQIGEFLGEEIVLTFQSCKGVCGVLIAEAHRPGLKEYIQQHAPVDAKVRFLDETTVHEAAPGSMNVVFAKGRVYIGERPELLKAAVTGGSSFAQTPFGGTVAGAYNRGVGLLVAVDLESTVARETSGADAAGMFANLGIDGVRHLLAEQRDINGRTNYSAVVSFNGARRGLASWLANPGAMGSLNFVSRDAQFATSFVVKDPSQMLRDALKFSQSFARSRLTLEEFERTTGVDMEDLASAVGGEVTFALDGPMMPVPSWKAIFEVRDPAKVQAAIEKMVTTANAKLQREGDYRVQLTRAPAAQSGLEIHTIGITGGAIAEANYAFVDGYLVIASSSAMLERAVADRRAGITLARSGDFRRLLPRNEQAHFSGMVYQNAGELIRLMAKGAGEAAGNAEQRQQVERISEKIEPMLLAIYGEEDRIELASQGSALNLIAQGMAGNLLGQAAEGTKRERRSYR